MFKWTVGLWFALLLGGGLLVMPQAIHDNIIAQLGLKELLPGGLPNRAILAGCAALLGFLIGLVIARRVSASSRYGSEAEDDFYESETAQLTYDGQDEETDLIEPRQPFDPRDIGEAGIGHSYADVESTGSTPDALVGAEAETEGPCAASGSSVGATTEEPIDTQTIAEDNDDSPPVSENGTTKPGERHSNALADLTLAELTQRLEQAIAASMTGSEWLEGDSLKGDDDPRVASLHEEAGSTGPSPSIQSGRGGSRSEIEDALDRLSQVRKQP